MLPYSYSGWIKKRINYKASNMWKASYTWMHQQSTFLHLKVEQCSYANWTVLDQKKGSYIIYYYIRSSNNAFFVPQNMFEISLCIWSLILEVKVIYNNEHKIQSLFKMCLTYK